MLIIYYFPTNCCEFSWLPPPVTFLPNDLKTSRGGGQQLHWKIHEDSGPGKGLIQATPGTKPEPTWRGWDEGWNVRCHVAIQENGWSHRSLEVETLEGTSKFFNILVAIHLFFLELSFLFLGRRGGEFFISGTFVGMLIRNLRWSQRCLAGPYFDHELRRSHRKKSWSSFYLSLHLDDILMESWSSIYHGHLSIYLMELACFLML